MSYDRQLLSVIKTIKTAFLVTAVVVLTACSSSKGKTVKGSALSVEPEVTRTDIAEELESDKPTIIIDSKIETSDDDGSGTPDDDEIPDSKKTDSKKTKLIVEDTPASNPKVVAKPSTASEPKTSSGKKVGKLVDSTAFMRPAGLKLDRQALKSVRDGESWWVNRELSSLGRNCATCHQGDNLFSESFLTPYPHAVAAVQKKADIHSIDIDEMVNYCLIHSMNGKAMGWNSNSLLALSAYVLQRQEKMRKKNGQLYRNSNTSDYKN